MGVLKPLLITGAAVVVLGVGAVLGDSAVRGVAEVRVAGQVQQELGLAEPPEVELGGTPFTAALITREVPSAALRATDVPVEVSGQQITLDTVEVVAQDLALGAGEVHVGSGRAEALVGYPALSTLAGVPVEAGDEPGRVQVSYTAALFGQQLVAVVSAVPALSTDATQVELTQTRISIAGFDLGENVAQRILDQVVEPIRLELPYGLVPESIEAAADGLTVAVTATDLTVPLE
ncbi:MAG: DUF2993 domain-containing protein [Propionicimonas sp.]|nr:DUF2993 domain-containing protein [Propionicimonas sp.]